MTHKAEDFDQKTIDNLLKGITKIEAAEMSCMATIAAMIKSELPSSMWGDAIREAFRLYRTIITLDIFSNTFLGLDGSPEFPELTPMQKATLVLFHNRLVKLAHTTKQRAQNLTENLFLEEEKVNPDLKYTRQEKHQ